MNHGALTPIVLSDSRSDKTRIGHEIIDATRAGMVPHPKAMCGQRKNRATGKLMAPLVFWIIVQHPKVMCGQRKNRANGKLHAPPVFRIHVPYVSHRRVAVADVARLWRRD